MEAKEFLEEKGWSESNNKIGGVLFNGITSLLEEYAKLKLKEFVDYVCNQNKGTINDFELIKLFKTYQMKCNCKQDETTGYTTVKCCNNCGLPIPGEVWDIPVKEKEIDWDEILITKFGTEITMEDLMLFYDKSNFKFNSPISEIIKDLLQKLSK